MMVAFILTSTETCCLAVYREMHTIQLGKSYHAARQGPKHTANTTKYCIRGQMWKVFVWPTPQNQQQLQDAWKRILKNST